MTLKRIGMRLERLPESLQVKIAKVDPITTSIPASSLWTDFDFFSIRGNRDTAGNVLKANHITERAVSLIAGAADEVVWQIKLAEECVNVKFICQHPRVP
ncbi:hypothetical protein ACHAQJ_006221 [Trichoderma viride]